MKESNSFSNLTDARKQYIDAMNTIANSADVDEKGKVVSRKVFYGTFFGGGLGPNNPIEGTIRRVRDSADGVRLVETRNGGLGLVGPLGSRDGLLWPGPLYTARSGFFGSVVQPFAFIDASRSSREGKLSTEDATMLFATVALVRRSSDSPHATITTSLDSVRAPGLSWLSRVNIVDEVPNLGFFVNQNGESPSGKIIAEAAREMIGPKDPTVIGKLAAQAYILLAEGDPSTLDAVLNAPLIGFNLPQKPLKQ